ncbi:MAG TPA: HAD-IB family phosphatase [Thermoanaerobaculia bacterium]|nr:HAD-IB family phosphatase [Thermoanaerobaculia bacterium]
MISSRYRLVFFDVDSTVVTIEGIDALAGANPDVARLTEAAMNGRISLDEVYARRLEMIRPSRADVDALARRYLESLTPGAEETIARLREGGAQVHLVTAGIAQAITPLAERFAIPARAVHAVALRFSPAGDYEDFDRRSPLARGGGKELVVRDVRARSKGKAAFIGDGVSDLEAKAAVELFVGYGGVRVRAKVKENADLWVEGPLTNVLPHLLERT